MLHVYGLAVCLVYLGNCVCVCVCYKQRTLFPYRLYRQRDDIRIPAYTVTQALNPSLFCTVNIIVHTNKHRLNTNAVSRLTAATSDRHENTHKYMHTYIQTLFYLICCRRIYIRTHILVEELGLFECSFPFAKKSSHIARIRLHHINAHTFNAHVCVSWESEYTRIV